MYQSLMKRYEGNPGAVKFNGEYLLSLPGLAAWRVMTVFCNA